MGKKRSDSMEKVLDIGMKLILACLLDATVVACEYNEAKKGLTAPAAHEGPEGQSQS